MNKVKVVVDTGMETLEFYADGVGVQGDVLVINFGIDKQVLVKYWLSAEVERVTVEEVEGETEVLS